MASETHMLKRRMAHLRKALLSQPNPELKLRHDRGMVSPMKKTLRHSAALILLFLIVAGFPVLADWQKLKPSDFTISDPPAQGSAEYKNDFAEILRLQEERTDADCKLGRATESHDFQTLFGKSELLDKEELARVKTVITGVMNVGSRASRHYKDEYRRPRPYDVDHRIKPCIRKPGGSKAYPSTHATVSMAAACVMAAVFPEREAQIMEYGASLGELRVIVGVHHPSDVATGQDLGMQVCRQILEDPTFKLP